MAKPNNINVAPGGGGGARTSGGITGKGGRNVTPYYKETGDSMKIIPANSTPRTITNSQWQKVLNKMPSVFKKQSN